MSDRIPRDSNDEQRFTAVLLASACSYMMLLFFVFVLSVLFFLLSVVSLFVAAPGSATHFLSQMNLVSTTIVGILVFLVIRKCTDKETV